MPGRAALVEAYSLQIRNVVLTKSQRQKSELEVVTDSHFPAARVLVLRYP